MKTGFELDRQWGWPLGRAERLARRGKLPHLVLPDGSIRFREAEVLRLVRRVPARQKIDSKKVKP